MNAKLNKNMVLRMVKYLRVLRKLKTLGIINVFSNNLGDALGVTPAMVRKDFSTLQISGNKRGGYNIDELMICLEDVLRKKDNKRVVLAGCGKIGLALIDYSGFTREGMEIIAGFDISEEKIDRTANVPVMHIDEMSDFIDQHNIKIGIISVPDSSANEVFEIMLNAGIKGILNFTPVALKCEGKCGKDNAPINCTVQSVNIGLELENLFYLINLRDGMMVQNDL